MENAPGSVPGAFGKYAMAVYSTEHISHETHAEYATHTCRGHHLLYAHITILSLSVGSFACDHIDRFDKQIDILVLCEIPEARSNHAVRHSSCYLVGPVA
jgi:hypothetical protein